MTKLRALSELPDILITQRIKQQITQAQLAERMNMVPQQISRYESVRYAGASLYRLLEIGKVLGLKFSIKVEYDNA